MTDNTNPHGRITVMQVFGALGITPTNSQSWSVGSRVQAEYAREFGEQPPKDNRPKTGGAGSHCFALYPSTWHPRIAAIIRSIVAFERSQGDMFQGDDEGGKPTI